MSNGLEVTDKGKDNVCDIGVVRSGKLTVIFNGSRNNLAIPDIRIRKSLRIIVTGDGNSLRIGDNCILEGLIMVSDGGAVSIGNEVTSQDFNILSFEGASVEIGNHCMFGRDVHIRNSDSHGIYDVISRQRINPARDTIIGDHVWMAHRTSLMKGVHLQKNSIVGAFSNVASGKYPEGVILAGAPAKVVREGIIWDRWLAVDLDQEGLSSYLMDYMPDV